MYQFRCDFSSCSESTEIRHADSSYVKNCAHTFFHKREIKASNTLWKSPLSTHSHTLFQFSRMEILHGLETGRERERGGGGGFSCNFVHIEKTFKTKKHLRKESAWQFSADSEQLENLQWNQYIHTPLFHRALQFKTRFSVSGREQDCPVLACSILSMVCVPSFPAKHQVLSSWQAKDKRAAPKSNQSLL